MRRTHPIPAALATLALATIALAACGSPGPASPPTPGTPPPAPGTAPTPGGEPLSGTPQSATPDPRSCTALVDGLSTEDRVGQLFMIGMNTGDPVTASYRQILTDSRAGHVVLLGNSSAGATAVKQLTDDLRAAAPQPAGVRLFVAVDQEGGMIQRLQGPGFDTIPAATVQAEQTPQELQRSAQHWAGQLRQAGVDVDLAPVADVVPQQRAASNAPIGQLRRHYGATPEQVTPLVQAFVRGMDEAGVATSLKHFPGLGHVAGNTDFTGNVEDDTVGRDDPGLAVFRDGIGAGADMVMVSTASYARIDPGVPATFSAVVIDDLLRGGLGFDGVVISDDLGAAQQVADIPAGERAVRFLAAGGDIVINGDPTLQAAMTRAVLDRAATDQEFADQIRVKAIRVVLMKAHRGAVSCAA